MGQTEKKMEMKTTCPQCGASFLQTTADLNDGFCLKCKKRGIDHDEVATGMELGFRFLAASFFGCLFAALGYGIGSAIWTGIGIVLALISFPIGLIYGFFCREINFFIRMLLRSVFHLQGD